MGLLDRLFRNSDTPAKRAHIQLASGRGFTFDIVGESRFQAALSRVCGGKIAEGHKHEATAELRFEQNPSDPSAIAVDIAGKQVGWIPSPANAEIRREIAALTPTGSANCKAKIVGGWSKDGDEGHFGVKLSLSRPLKIVAER
jgi:hypothetical protein